MQGVRVDSDYPIQSAKEREEKKKLRATLSSPHTPHTTHFVLMFCFMVKRSSLVLYCAWAGPVSHSLFWRSTPSWIAGESKVFFFFFLKGLSAEEK